MSEERSNAQKAAIRLSIERMGKGVCQSCGSPNPINPQAIWATCSDCSRKKKESLPEGYMKAYIQKWLATEEGRAHQKQRLNNARQDRLDRIAQGRCNINYCPNPPAQGKHRCQHHIDYFKERYEASKAKKQAEHNLRALLGWPAESKEK